MRTENTAAGVLGCLTFIGIREGYSTLGIDGWQSGAARTVEIRDVLEKAAVVY